MRAGWFREEGGGITDRDGMRWCGVLCCGWLGWTRSVCPRGEPERAPGCGAENVMFVKKPSDLILSLHFILSHTTSDLSMYDARMPTLEEVISGVLWNTAN